MTLRSAVRDWLPPKLTRLLRGASPHIIRFDGDYVSWQDARRDADGYDAEAIVQRVYRSEIDVSEGRAADERDGVLFDAVQYSLPVMAALARIVCKLSRAPRVLDFGGAFGGSYRQYRAFGLPAGVSWNVVDQAEFVRLGKSSFETTELRFSENVEEVLAQGLPDVALFSSVLQYIEDPSALVLQVTQAGVPHVIVDRTPCWKGERNVLSVQHVPPEIYEARYPCWIFSRSKLLELFEQHYRPLAAFSDVTGQWECAVGRFELAGFILDRTQPQVRM
jgi:putative methyltransferase (TIGR04325 family)